jgi:hypothetical protein
MRKKPGKPTLTVVAGTASNPMAAPSNLSKAGADLWRTIMAEYEIGDSGGREILRQACAGADRAAECAEAIARDGPMVRTPQGLKDHPLLKHELASRAFVVRSLHRLGLDLEPTRPAAGRPSGAGC